MKKTILVVSFIVMFVLSACTGTALASTPQVTQSSTTSAATSVSGPINTSYTDAVSVAAQLAAGTISLDGTANAVTKDQAVKLVTLWESLQSLTQQNQPGGQGGNMPGNNGAPQQPGSQAPSNSTTPGADSSTASANSPSAPAAPADQSSTPNAPQELANQNQTKIDAVVAQIETAMTTDQLNAISAQQLTQTNVKSILKAKGFSSSAPQQNGNGQNPPAANGTAAPQGTPPAGMPTPDATQQANGQPSGKGQQPGNGQMGASLNSIQPGVVNAVIQYLANIAGVTVPTSQPMSAAGNGAPAGNNPGSAAGGNAGGSSSSAITTVKAGYTVDGQEANQSGQTYVSTAQDTSAIFVTNNGKFTLANPTVTTTGSTSSSDNSSFYGLNAGILVNQGASLTMSGGSVTTSGSGANGVFSSGTGSNVTIANTTINASGDGGHAVMATLAGTMTLTDVNMTTSGGSASAIATDRGSGTITVSGGTVKTSGNNSAGIYSTGKINADGITITSTGAEAAVIEGANSISLTDSSLTSTKADKWGVLIYQSMSGDAEGAEGNFDMSGGSLALSAVGGPLFYVTNTTANITLKGVGLNVASGTLLNAASGSWGNAGSNGGNVYLTADSQTLTGNVTVDANSTAKFTLQNQSTLTGALNSDATAKDMELILDATSLWNVTADSYLTCLTDANGISGASISNINGNGHTVYYVSASCPTLNGKTYTLAGSGTLQPAK